MYNPPPLSPLPSGISAQAIAVDAACSGNPGPMEYRGVWLETGQVLFHLKYPLGTNNIGEFLAVVHALALLSQRGKVFPVYTDSVTALAWVRLKKCKTTLRQSPTTNELFALISRAERWLHAHTYDEIPLLKWDTSRCGEIPADFGRK